LLPGTETLQAKDNLFIQDSALDTQRSSVLFSADSSRPPQPPQNLHEDLPFLSELTITENKRKTDPFLFRDVAQAEDFLADHRAPRLFNPENRTGADDRHETFLLSGPTKEEMNPSSAYFHSSQQQTGSASGGNPNMMLNPGVGGAGGRPYLVPGRIQTGSSQSLPLPPQQQQQQQQQEQDNYYYEIHSPHNVGGGGGGPAYHQAGGGGPRMLPQHQQQQPSSQPSYFQGASSQNPYPYRQQQQQQPPPLPPQQQLHHYAQPFQPAGPRMIQQQQHQQPLQQQQQQQQFPYRSNDFYPSQQFQQQQQQQQLQQQQPPPGPYLNPGARIQTLTHPSEPMMYNNGGGVPLPSGGNQTLIHTPWADMVGNNNPNMNMNAAAMGNQRKVKGKTAQIHFSFVTSRKEPVTEDTLRMAFASFGNSLEINVKKADLNQVRKISAFRSLFFLILSFSLAY
jgi:hypothetical protein